MFQGIFKSAIKMPNTNINYIFGTGSIPINIKVANLETFAKAENKQQGYQVAEVNKLISTMLTGWDANGNKPKSMSDNYLELILSCDNGFVVKKRLQFPHIIAWQNDNTPYNIADIYKQFSIDNWLKADDFENPDITLVVEPTDEILTTSTANPPEATTTNSGRFYLYYRNLPVGVNRIHIDFHIKTKTEPIDFDLEVIDGLSWKDAQTILASNDQAKINVLLSSVKDVYNFTGAEGDFDEITMHEWNALYQQIISLKPNNKFTHDLFFVIYINAKVTTEKLADRAVTTAKIADGAVTTEKLNNNFHNFLQEEIGGQLQKLESGINTKITELESEVSMSIYDSRIQTSSTNPSYENTIAEIYIIQDYLKDIDYVDFRDYQAKIFMYAFNGPVDFNANVIWSVTNVILSDKSNGQVIPLKCTSAGGNISVGDIVGYVVFKDIDTFKSMNTDGLGNVLNLANVTRLYRQLKISNYLFGLDGLGDNVKKLSDDTKKLSDDTKKLSDDVKKLKSEVNGEIDFVDSFSMVGNGKNYHQANASTIDISKYAGKEIVISLGSVSSSESTINSCIIGYVQTSSGESLNNTGIIKAGNSAKILLPSNAGKILIQAFPAYNGTGIPDVDGATYTFEDIRTFSGYILEARVEDLNVRVESLEGNTKEIQIPSTIFAVVGTELNIWNDTVSYSIDRGIVSPLNYAISWKSYVGIVTDRGFHFTPLPEHAGNTYALLCIMYNDKKEVARKTISIVVKANSLNSQKNIVFFGDSTGASSATELYNALHNSERFTGVIPTMLGSRGTNTIRYEAFGGARWVDFATAGRAAFRCYVTNAPTIPLNARYTNNGFTWQVVEVNITDGVGNILITKDSATYTDTPEPNGTLVSITSGVQDITYNSYENAPANPLWDSTQNALSISHYKDVLGISQSTKFDAVFFQLGLNHSDLGENFENLVGYITALYNLFVNDNPNCIVILGLTTTAGNTQDGSGVNYGASIPPITHNIRMYNLRNEYIKLINGGTMPNLRIAPTNNNVDRYYGYDFSQRTVNYTIGGVSKSETIMYHNNMVHPGPIGYRQMGDAYFNALIGSLIIVE